MAARDVSGNEPQVWLQVFLDQHTHMDGGGAAHRDHAILTDALTMTQTMVARRRAVTVQAGGALIAVGPQFSSGHWHLAPSISSRHSWAALLRARRCDWSQ